MNLLHILEKWQDDTVLVDIYGKVATTQEFSGFIVNIESTRNGKYILSICDESLEKYVWIHMEDIQGYYEGLDEVYISLIDGSIVRVDRQ